MKLAKYLKWFGGIKIFLAALGLSLLAHNSSGFAAWYAARVFPVFRMTIGWFFGLFPFSVFELGLFALILYILAAIGVNIYRLFHAHLRGKVKAFLLRLSYAVPSLFLLFVLTAGINYNRESYADHVGITVRDSSPDELVRLYLILVERAEILSREIETDSYGHFVLRRDGLYQYARRSMRELNELYGGLGNFFPRAKAPFTSRLILSNFRIAGFFSPWTMEAHYNGDMPGHRIPFIVNHELAHFSGHMREDEANFIAYLAGRNSERVDFQYSAVYEALRYTLNALFRVVSSERYSELFAMLPPQIQRDMAVSRAYWQAFQGRAADIAARANDAYLRLNQQEGGVQSYGRMVDLLLAYYRSQRSEVRSQIRACLF